MKSRREDENNFQSRYRTYAKAVYTVPALTAETRSVCDPTVERESCAPAGGGFLLSLSTWKLDETMRESVN